MLDEAEPVYPLTLIAHMGIGAFAIGISHNIGS
jgi:hypothetical protein